MVSVFFFFFFFFLFSFVFFFFFFFFFCGYRWLLLFGVFSWFLAILFSDLVALTISFFSKMLCLSRGMVTLPSCTANSCTSSVGVKASTCLVKVVILVMY